MTTHPRPATVDATTAARLAATRFPQWRHHPVTPIVSHGTVNTLHRLGDHIVLRFPLQPVTDPAPLHTEQDHARRLHGRLPVDTPEPLGVGNPGEGYDGHWSAYTWIEGHTAQPHQIAPTDLAALIRALHDIGAGGERWNGHSRGGPLHTKDDWVRHSLDRSHHLTDTAALTRIWDDCLAAPAHPGPDVLLHADLMPGNLLVRDGHLAALIDLGTMSAGDPAVDLMPAWNLFDAGERATFRDALAAGDALWQRGRGWALCQAIGALWYYADTNPVMAGTARTTLDAVLNP